VGVLINGWDNVCGKSRTGGKWRKKESLITEISKKKNLVLLVRGRDDTADLKSSIIEVGGKKSPTEKQLFFVSGWKREKQNRGD